MTENAHGENGSRNGPRRERSWPWLLLALVLVVLWQAGEVLLLAFAGLLIAVFLCGVIEQLRGRLGLSRGVATAAVLGALLLALAGCGFLIAPQVAEQADRLAERLPQSLSRLEEIAGRYEWSRQLVSELQSVETMVMQRPGFFAQATGVISSTFGFLASLLLVGFVGVFVTVNPTVYIDGVIRVTPPERRDRTREILGKLGETLRWWLLGKLLSMVMVGVLIGSGLWLLGVPLALTLAVLAALLTFIPNIGPLIALIPPLLLALSERPVLALWVLLLYAGVQFLESYVISPLIHDRTVSLPPALTIVMQALLAILLGLVGLAMAVPLTVAAMVLIEEVHVKGVLRRSTAG